MRSLLPFLIAFVITVGCSPKKVDPDVPDGPIDCDKACLNMQEAGCEEGDPSPKQGNTCKSWCNDYHEPGYMPPWAGCVAAAGPNPDRIESCNMQCTRK